VSTISLGRFYYRQLSPRLLLQLPVSLLSDEVVKELRRCGGSLDELVAVMALSLLTLLLHDCKNVIDVPLGTIERERSSKA